MLAPLAGWTVGVTADRRAEEQLELLRRRGASVLHGPAVRTVPFDDDTPMRAATDALIARPPDVLIATTGIGIRGWFGAAEAWGLDADLYDALRWSRIVARGPKARGALQQVGLLVWRNEPTERLDRVVDHLQEIGVDGLRVAIQRHGEPASRAVDLLRGAGAEVIDVPIYRWTTPSDDAPLRRLLAELLAGQLDAVTFTSVAAVRNLVALADESGVGDVLHQAFADGIVAAAVGPVTADGLAAVGIEPTCAPDQGRLGLLVRCLSEEARRRHRHLRAGRFDVVLQGGLVTSGGVGVDLHGRERTLFDALAARPGAVLGREALLRRVWTSDHDLSSVDTGIGRLRRTLRAVGLTIEVVPRRGWALQASDGSCPDDASDAATLMASTAPPSTAAR